MHHEAANSPDWLAGGGETGERIRAKDWSASLLGRPETWPLNVKSAVGICLSSSFPILLWLGPELRLIYNDPCIPFLGEAKHPSALGEVGREVWKEIWPAIGPMHEEVAAGRSTSVKDLQMLIARRLAREEVYVTFSFSPIFANGRRSIDGVFCACNETTEKVVGGRRLVTLRDLGALSREPRAAEQACRDAAEVLRANALDIPFSAIYLLGEDQTSAHRVAWTGSDDCRPAFPKSHPLVDSTAAAPWPLGLVAHTGQAQQVLDLPTAVGVFPAPPWSEAVPTAFALPLLAATRKRPAGFLIVGVNPCRILDSDYRSFLELVAGHIARSIADAEAREGGRKRAEALAEIDRTKTNVSHEALRRLPIEGEAAAPVGDMADNSATVSRMPDGGTRARILVADGNPDMRAYLSQLLSPRWVVDAVADAQAALDAARHRKPDLVLADMMTPRLNGVQLLSALRRDHGLCHIPVILLCARAGEEEQVEGLRIGADGYVVKPFAARELIARIDTGLTLGRLRAAEMADLSRLHELSTRLTATCDLASLLREVLDATIELQGADFGHIQLYDHQEEALEITAQRGFTQEFMDHFRRVYEFTDSSSGRALRQRQRVIIEDIEVDPLYAPLRTMAASAGFRAVQSTPLFARDGEQLVGMLSTHFRSVHRPTPRELRLLDLYARQAADVIAFRLAEQRLRESEELTHDDLTALTTLHEVSTRSLQLNALQPVLEMTLDAAISLAHGQRGNLQLFNDDKGVLEIAAHRGFKQPFLDFFREVHGELGAYCGASMELGKAVVVEDVNASDIFKGTPSLAVLRQAGARAVISVPLVARSGRFVGMTNVHFANPHRPDVRVMQRLEVLGRQAADFIERMNILHHLRQSEARLQAAVHLVSLGLYAWDPQSNDMLWDDAMRAMWGLPAGSPVTYDVWLAGVHPEDRVRVEEAVRRCADAKGDGIYDIEYRVIGRTDGVERWIATRGQTTFENDRPISFYGVAQDVTDRKRTESKLQSRVEARTRELLDLNRHLSSQIEQRKIAEAALDKLQQLDAIGQITPGVAHDFNNLLSVVLTNARLLSRKSMESDDREGIELILAAAERGTKLTAQLLAFAGKQRLEPQIVDLNQKVADMRDLLAATLGDTVQLRAHLHPQLWPALADPTQLEMIILNLAINSRDAMPSGGSVTIETFNTAIGDQPVRPEDPESGEYVGLAIRDTGEGIPEHVLARVFEPFFTTKRRGEGSGLGLAQVLSFAKQSGGGMRIETRVGEGTCVKVFLPRADVDPKA